MRGERQLRDLLPPAQRQQASDFATSGKTTDYTATVSVAPDETTLLWGLVGNGAWDLSSANWKGQSSGLTSLFYNGKHAIFDKTTGGAITIVAGVDNRKTLILTQLNSATTGTNPGRGEISGSIGDSVLGTVGQLATSVTKSSFSSWTLSGVNTYSGATKVQAGTLAFSRSNSLGSGSLDITAGAKVQLDYIGTRQISALTYDAGAAKPNGSYGSSRSLATFKDDTRFTGLGTATVAGSTPAGSVTFYNGTNPLGTATLNGGGLASFAPLVTSRAVGSPSPPGIWAMPPIFPAPRLRRCFKPSILLLAMAS